MKQTLSLPDLQRSIISLPPVARTADGAINAEESEKIVRWLASAGVSNFMYGGIANLFNIAVSEYAGLLETIERITPADSLVVPGIGPDCGKALDQVKILKSHGFPTAILLPFAPVTQAGVATGLRRLSDAFGRPLMVFFKSADYVASEDLVRLVKDGALCAIEYGIALEKAGDAPYLERLVDGLGTADCVIDGAGEKTIPFTARYGVRSYTSGSGNLAPHMSMALLRAVQSGEIDNAKALSAKFVPYETVRAKHSAIPVVHDGVRFAGIAETGPLGPFFSSGYAPDAEEEVSSSAQALKAANAAYAWPVATERP